MPELPDIAVYCERIEVLGRGATLTGLRLGNPFVLRTVEPPASELAGRALCSAERVDKRLLLGFEGERFALIHLMLLGRLQWRSKRPSLKSRTELASFDLAWPDGREAFLLLTEQGSRKRASVHLLKRRAELAGHQRDGLEVPGATDEQLRARLLRENRTLKRALTDPRILAGIGNTFSDEILFAARLSPVRLTHRLEEEELVRLMAAIRSVLSDWTEKLRAEVGDGWPRKVRAVREGMAVHGRYGAPCPVCGSPIQRIRYGDREANYCARCQNAGRLLADRGLSRLMKKDWPKTLDGLEALKARQTLDRG